MAVFNPTYWRRATPVVAVAAIVTACLTVSLSPMSAQAMPRATHHIPIATINLRSRYQALLPSEGTRLHPIAISYAEGHGGAAAVRAPASTCAEPHCPVSWGSGDVQTAPKLYLLLWGPNWSAETAASAYLDSFLSGLGVEPTDAWSTTLEQYYGANGSPSFSADMLQGVYTDTSIPPSGATQAQLQAEADALYSDQGLTGAVNDEVIVATQSGTCPQGFYAASCAGGSGDYCAWHTSGSYGETFTNLPYLPDAGLGCGEGSVDSPGTYDGFSIVEGHEYAESVSDPYPYGGWWDSNDSSGGEIGDKCAWSGLENDPFSTGSFPMQPMWSNNAKACVQRTTGASALAFTAEPPPSSAAGERFSVRVSVEDPFAHVVTSSSADVRIALIAGPVGARLSCSSDPVAASTGVAAFSCSVAMAGTGYKLGATSSGLSSAKSSSFAITAPRAAKLAFTTEPPTRSVAGSRFTVKVSVESSYGIVVTSSRADVRIALVTGPIGARLSCASDPLAAWNGVAAFSCSVAMAGTGYKLGATSSGLSSTTSSTFDIAAA